MLRFGTFDTGEEGALAVARAQRAEVPSEVSEEDAASEDGDGEDGQEVEEEEEEVVVWWERWPKRRHHPSMAM